MLVLASAVFLYYTIWTLLLVRLPTPALRMPLIDVLTEILALRRRLAPSSIAGFIMSME